MGQMLVEREPSPGQEHPKDASRWDQLGSRRCTRKSRFVSTAAWWPMLVCSFRSRMAQHLGLRELG